MNSFISRVGGKRLLRGQITDRFPTEGVERYVEVFGGAGWVLFHKPRHAAQEVFNDLDGELVNLFRVVKYHAGELARELDSLPVSREIYLDKRSLGACTGLTDIQRAARYFLPGENIVWLGVTFFWREICRPSRRCRPVPRRAGAPAPRAD